MRNLSSTTITSVLLCHRPLRAGTRCVCAALLLAMLSGLSGCTNVFFYPSRQQVLSPQQFGLSSQDIKLVSVDGIELFAWHLPVENARGVVCFFHGNAENISTHIGNVVWLPPAGYEVLLLDYRGYGASAGKADFPEALEDVQAALDWCLARGTSLQVPVYAFGQSLGAAMVLDVAARSANREKLSGVIADSSFSSYRRIARDALSHSWLLGPFRHPLSWLLTAQHAPEEAAGRIDGLPLLVLHSIDDGVVPYAHAGRILAEVKGRACFLPTHGPHNASLNPLFPHSEKYRQAVLDFMSAAVVREKFECPSSARDPFVARKQGEVAGE